MAIAAPFRFQKGFKRDSSFGKRLFRSNPGMQNYLPIEPCLTVFSLILSGPRDDVDEGKGSWSILFQNSSPSFLMREETRNL